MPDRPKPKPKTPKKPKKPKPRNWSWERTGDGIWCYSSDKDLCTTVTRLWEGHRSDIHDAELQSATKDINEIIDHLERENEDSSRRLSFINFQGRLMLVWTHCGEVVSSYDDDAEIAKALKVKGFTAR